jgi:hypothetical protein
VGHGEVGWSRPRSVVVRAGKGRKGKRRKGQERAGQEREGQGRAGQGRAVRISIALHCTALQRLAVAWLPPTLGTARNGTARLARAMYRGCTLYIVQSCTLYTVSITELYTVHSVQRIPVYSCSASVQLLGGPWLHYEGAGSQPLQ